MKSRESQPIEGKVVVVEFVFDEKKDLKQERSNDTKKKKIIEA